MLSNHISARVSPRSLEILSFWAKAILASALMAVAAQISIPLPFVPITGQTLALIIIAFTLGSKLATASLTLYLLEGALGLPVFANGTFGISALFGPSGGYLLSFPFAAFVMGKLADNGCLSSFVKTSLAATLGTGIVFIGGLAQLSFFIPAADLLQVGLYPFILGGIVKAFIATLIAPSIFKLIQKKK